MKRQPRPLKAAIPWVLLAALPLLGACDGFLGPPDAKPVPPIIPSPFENYPSARVPAYKRPPLASPSMAPQPQPSARDLPGGEATR